MRETILSYFRGERAEMLAFLGVGIVYLGAGVVLLMRGQRFGRGLAYVLIVGALAAAATAIPILLRDPPHRDRLVASLGTSGQDAALAAETMRMDGVISRYPFYRYVYITLLIAAVASAVFIRGPLWNGVALGLFLVAATGLVVDHFSERRALGYHRELTHTLEAGG